MLSWLNNNRVIFILSNIVTNFNSYDFPVNVEECFLNGLDLEVLVSILDNFNQETERVNKIYKNNFQLELIKFNLFEIIDIIKIFLDNKKDYIKWISLYKRNLKNYVSLYNSDANIKDFIFNKINKKFPSFFICSATFTINNSFSFFLNNTGINDDLMDSVNTRIYKSPFYYDEQSKFYVFNKKIEINSDSYISTISNQIASLNINLNKRMLILCTSYKQVKSIGNNLLNNDKIDNDIIFMQASKFSKNSILKNYKKEKNSILIGTSTFWEGVDLPRDLLEILDFSLWPDLEINKALDLYMTNRFIRMGLLPRHSEEEQYLYELEFKKNKLNICTLEEREFEAVFEYLHLRLN